jgi:hypothetical protein
MPAVIQSMANFISSLLTLVIVVTFLMISLNVVAPLDFHCEVKVFPTSTVANISSFTSLALASSRSSCN